MDALGDASVYTENYFNPFVKCLSKVRINAYMHCPKCQIILYLKRALTLN